MHYSKKYCIFKSGGWNNNPSAMQFKYHFRHLMVRCGVRAGTTGNVTAQDETTTLSLASVDMTCAVPADDVENGPSPFQDSNVIMQDHSYLPTQFGHLVENALVYIAGFVVKSVCKQLQCDTCRSSLITASVPSSLGDSYHLLTLRNNGGLVIPSSGTVKVVRTAEQCLRQSGRQDMSSAAHQASALEVSRAVRAKLGSEDVFDLGEHIIDTQYGIDNHHYQLMSQVTHTFYKLRQHHVAKLHTLKFQGSSSRKKLTKAILFKGY